MNNIIISDDKTQLNIEKIHQFLTTESTWAIGISMDTVIQSIEHSICIGAYLNGEQVGFSRIITDQSTFANLVDVIVWPEYRGKGISKLLLNAAISHSTVEGVRRFTLATSNAHGLYRKLGFTQLS